MRSQLVWPVLSFALVLAVAITSHAASTVIMSYDAGTNGLPAAAPDPTSVEGGNWNLVAANLGSNLVSEGLSPDPLHTNLNAWRTLDNLTTAGAARFSKVATDAQITNAIWCGWKASAYLRLADPVPGNAGSITIFFQFGSTNALWNRRSLAYVEIDSSGALYASSTTATATITTNAADALGYHLFELVYDNATHTTALRVDGVVISDNWPCWPSRLRWTDVFGELAPPRGAGMVISTRSPWKSTTLLPLP